jgi:hypothetical protein
LRQIIFKKRRLTFNMDFDFERFRYQGKDKSRTNKTSSKNTATSHKRKQHTTNKTASKNTVTSHKRKQPSTHKPKDWDILCKQCRKKCREQKSGALLRQESLSRFFSSTASSTNTAALAPPPPLPTAAGGGEGASASQLKSETSKIESDDVSEGKFLICGQCRRPMQEKALQPGPRKYSACPFITRLRGYQRVAKEKAVVFELKDSEAAAMMRLPCAMCGLAAPIDGNGITRLGKTTERSMGPYNSDNCMPCCSRCNLMKGCHGHESFVEICRHIATHNEMGKYIAMAAVIAAAGLLRVLSGC